MFWRRIRDWKLRRQRDALRKSRVQFFAGRSVTEAAETLAQWRAGDGWKLDLIEAIIRENDSVDLVTQARKLGLPTPDRAEKNKWVNQADFGMAYLENFWHVLTTEAFTELRTSVRKELRERREAWEFRLRVWGTIVAILTGLIGASIGLVSVLKK
jgi:hypothetical protein